MTPIDPRKAAGLLAWSVVIASSLSPFEFALSPVCTTESSPLADARRLQDLVLHLMAFTAVGGIDYLGARRRGSNQRHVRPAVVRGLLGCVGIEAAQLFIPCRHASLLDLCMNGAGLLLGNLGARAAIRQGLDRRVASLRRVRSPRAELAFLVFWAAAWTGVLLLPAWQISLNRWDSGYPLLIGNEAGGERPWRGTIQYVAIYNRALSPDEVGRIFGEPPERPGTTPARRTMGLIAAYDLTGVGEREVVPDGETPIPALRLRLPAGSRWMAGTPPALQLDGVTLATGGPAAELTSSIKAKGTFSVEVWCRPASLSQTGPARIVGISDGVSRRNFTLGQEGDALSFRVRNGFNGPNGNNFELRVPGALTDDQRQIVATYDDGVSWVYRDGRSLGATVDMREPSFLIGLGARLGGHMMAALLAALSLIVGSSLFSQHPVGLGRLLLVGYCVLLLPPAAGVLLAFPATMSLQIWFGPALLLCWIWLQRVSR